MARTTKRHTIVRVRGLPFSPAVFEAVGTGTIVPGQLLEYEANGKVQQHSVAGGVSEKLVALENPVPDMDQYPETDTIDIPYADGDKVFMGRMTPGDVAYLWLADGENVSKGIDFLASDGSGRVVSIGTGVTGSDAPVGVAYEDKNNSAGGTAVRVLVRIV